MVESDPEFVRNHDKIALEFVPENAVTLPDADDVLPLEVDEEDDEEVEVDAAAAVVDVDLVLLLPDDEPPALYATLTWVFEFVLALQARLLFLERLV